MFRCVAVYEIPSGKVLAAFSGHLRIVYDLCWSRDDGRLLSASSDGTVRCVSGRVTKVFDVQALHWFLAFLFREWNVEKLLGTAQKVLPHPSFVYCARYHPSAQNLVVTGSFDFLVRVWRLDVSDVNGQLLQEFDGHSSFINSLCFDSAGQSRPACHKAPVTQRVKGSLPNFTRKKLSGKRQKTESCLNRESHSPFFMKNSFIDKTQDSVFVAFIRCQSQTGSHVGGARGQKKSTNCLADGRLCSAQEPECFLLTTAVSSWYGRQR